MLTIFATYSFVVRQPAERGCMHMPLRRMKRDERQATRQQ